MIKEQIEEQNPAPIIGKKKLAPMIFLITILIAFVILIREHTLVNDTISISPGQYQTQSYKTRLPFVKLKGKFIAQGGSKNDVIVLIMTEKNYFNWRNGLNASALYNSGKVSADRFEIDIESPDTFYIIFSNTFSTFSTKHVIVEIKYSYRVW